MVVCCGIKVHLGCKTPNVVVLTLTYSYNTNETHLTVPDMLRRCVLCLDR